jgi:ketosteroid isomerase-like protein
MDAVLRGFRAQNAHDLVALRALLPDDFVFHDHRRTGLGRLERADAFVVSVAALLEQAPDVTFEVLYTIAAAPHALLEMARMFGTLANGGGAVEGIYARLCIVRDGRVAAMELYEPGDLERALARFEALRAARA